jgi:FkbM family methyltransferase
MEDLNKIFVFLEKLFPNYSEDITIFDIGSRDCKEAIEFSKRYQNAKIYSFEPNPDAIKIAKKNISNFKNITLVEKAVSNINGSVDFYPINPELTESPHEDGNIGASSLFKASGKYPLEKYVQNKITVESITIEKFCEDNGIEAIDFVWMDLQGAEYLALNGFGKLLSNVKIIHTEAELFEIYEGQHFFKDIQNLLNKTHFLIDGDTKHNFFNNYIFIKKEFFRIFLKEFIKYKLHSIFVNIKTFLKPLKRIKRIPNKLKSALIR